MSWRRKWRSNGDDRSWRGHGDFRFGVDSDVGRTVSQSGLHQVFVKGDDTLIETARLVLRPMVWEDVDELLRVFADPKVMASGKESSSATGMATGCSRFPPRR